MEKSKGTEKNRLGRGLAALIPQAPAAQTAGPARNGGAESASDAHSADGVQELPLSKIAPNTFQPRTEFDPAALNELAESIAVHGVLQPVMVRPAGRDRYELIAGERRFRAAEKAGLVRIPAIIREMTDEDSLTVALIENIQREDLNAIEAARGYRQLLDQFGLTQSELARQIGKSQPTIANGLRLLKLSPEIQDSIADGRITEEHGKALLAMDDPEHRRKLWRYVLQNQLNVADTRRLVAAESLPADPAIAGEKKQQRPNEIHWKALEDRLRSALGMKVAIRSGPSGRGVLTVEFSHHDEIEGILEKLGQSE